MTVLVSSTSIGRALAARHAPPFGKVALPVQGEPAIPSEVRPVQWPEPCAYSVAVGIEPSIISFRPEGTFRHAGDLPVSCVVADGGIGVKQSLWRNPAIRDRVSYDWDALELAVRERVSGTGDPHRGIGLYGVSEDVRKPGRSFLLHSGLGSLEISEELESQARRTRLFPGTLAYLAIPA